MVGEAKGAPAGDVVDSIADDNMAESEAAVDRIEIMKGIAGKDAVAGADERMFMRFGIACGGIVEAVFAEDISGVGKEMGRAGKGSDIRNGIKIECIGKDAHRRVAKGDAVVDEKKLLIGIVIAHTAVEDPTAVGGMTKLGIGSSTGDAVVGEVRGVEASGAVDEKDRIAPDVDNFGDAIIVEFVAIDESSVGENDFDIIESIKIVQFEVDESGIGVQGHTLMTSSNLIIEDPHVGVVGVAGAYARFILDEMLGKKGREGAEREKGEKKAEAHKKLNIRKAT